MEVDKSARGYSEYRQFTLERDAKDLRVLNKRMEGITLPLMLCLAIGGGAYALYGTLLKGGDPNLLLSSVAAAICGYRIMEHKSLKKQADALEKKWQATGVRLSDHI